MAREPFFLILCDFCKRLDYERLMQGKALFDRDALNSLEKSDNNNDRYEMLTTIAEYIIPNYDDIGGVYPELCRTFIKVVNAARDTETKPIESPFGNFSGNTAKDVALIAVEVFDKLRYVDIRLTIHSLIDLYKSEHDEEVRERIVKGVGNLSHYDLHVWEKAGPYVQIELAKVIKAIDQHDLPAIGPIVRTVWRELLRPDMHSNTFTASAVTIHDAAVPGCEDVKRIRSNAIEELIEVFDQSSSVAEKKEVFDCLSMATRRPLQGGCSNELRGLVLENATQIVKLLAERADKLPYELLEHIEHQILFIYRGARGVAIDEQDRFGCKGVAKNLVRSILAFRDQINKDSQFIRYKTLVGFNAVFEPHWEDDEFDYGAVEEFRKQAVVQYVSEVSNETADDWYRLIRICAATKSNDLTAFQFFREFLIQLGKVQPKISIMFLQREDKNVVRFLPAILKGLSESVACDEYSKLLAGYLDKGIYLASIAWHYSEASSAVLDVKKVLSKAIATGDTNAVIKCLSCAVKRHDPQNFPLVEDVFIPALKFLNAKGDTRWIYEIYFLRESKIFFKGLLTSDIDLVLKNLLDVAKIDFHVDRILAYIADKNPGLVWDFFRQRLHKKREGQICYEAIPYNLYDLGKILAKDANLAIVSLLGWFHPGDMMFEFAGGRLIHAVFQTFTADLTKLLEQIVDSGSDEDLEFVIQVLRSYCGEPTAHEILKKIIDRLPEDDPKIEQLTTCLDNTGAVCGEFGIVEAFRKKKEEMALWKNDSRLKVERFAEAHIRRLDQKIASEQRTAEQRKELWWRKWE